MNIKQRLLGIYWTWAGILIQILRNPKRLIELPGELLGAFISYRRYCKINNNLSPVLFRPVLFQNNIESTFDAHYVIQGWWATNRILAIRPSFHIDISSNVSFVAQLAAVIPVRYYEFNPPTLCLPNLERGSANLVKLHFADASIECLSCLHVLEHIGLGRYGDSIDPGGMMIACAELSRCVKNNGYLLVSFPIGNKRVEFNGQRITNPIEIYDLFPGMDVEEFSYVNDDGKFVENVGIESVGSCNYGCGFFLLKKVI